LDGSDNLAATLAADRAFPAAVAELGLGGITLYEKHHHHRSYGSHYFDSWLW
jgi:hypothetical protein